jgi:hypothetical protein
MNFAGSRSMVTCAHLRFVVGSASEPPPALSTPAMIPLDLLIALAPIG